MKTLAIILFCCTAVFAHAQLTLGIKAGYNTTNPHFPKSVNNQNQKGSSGNGWQAALHVQQGLHKWFVYSGAGLIKNTFYSHAYYWGSSSKTYHPLYLTIPLGAGYTFNFHKNFSIKLYGGVYGQAGIGGKVKTVTMPYCDFVACPEAPPISVDEHKIVFKSGTTDLEPVNAGLQFGAGLQLLKKLELDFTFYKGLTNIIPKDFNYTMHLNMFAIDAKFNVLPWTVKK